MTKDARTATEQATATQKRIAAEQADVESTSSLVMTCGFVKRANGEEPDASEVIAEFERSTGFQAPPDAASWTLTEINLFFLSSGAIQPKRKPPASAVT